MPKMRVNRIGQEVLIVNDLVAIVWSAGRNHEEEPSNTGGRKAGRLHHVVAAGAKKTASKSWPVMKAAKQTAQAAILQVIIRLGLPGETLINIWDFDLPGGERGPFKMGYTYA
jgi:hypothetical protein